MASKPFWKCLRARSPNFAGCSTWRCSRRPVAAPFGANRGSRLGADRQSGCLATDPTSGSDRFTFDETARSSASITVTGTGHGEHIFLYNCVDDFLSG